MEYALPISISSYFYFGKLVTSFAPYQGGSRWGGLAPFGTQPTKKKKTMEKQKEICGSQKLCEANQPHNVKPRKRDETTES